LDSKIFDYLKLTKEDSSNEIQLTDAIKLMLLDHKIYACEYHGNKFDCGSKSGYVEATVFMGLRDENIAQALKKYI
jgi:UTP--glucose-1-phosphate uridylyltransferase